MRCSQSAPSVIGSRIPLSSRTGIITMLMTGAITSSLLVVSASALDAAAQPPPTSSVISDAEDDAAERAAHADRVAEADQDQRLHEQLEHVARTAGRPAAPTGWPG